MFDTLQEVIDIWKDEPEIHTQIFNTFFDKVQEDEELKKFRDFVEQHEFGYGDRPYYWMWNLIVRSLPENFRVTEIGIYMGQTISLISLLNKRYNKKGIVYAITPLEPADDKYSKHHDVDYYKKIQELYAFNKLNGTDLRIIKGLSNDKEIVSRTNEIAPFDCFYIDGSHNYEIVVSDIQNYTPMVKVGGLVVMDDACLDLNISDGLIRHNWKGMQSVTQAVNNTIDKDERFKVIFTVGHNKIYRRIK